MVKTDFKRSSSGNFLRIIFSRQSLIIFTFLAVTGLTLVISLITPPKYEAVVKILVKVRKAEGSLPAQTFYDFRTERVAFLQSQEEIIRSDEVARRVLGKLFPTVKEFPLKKVKSFQQRVKVFSPAGHDLTTSDILWIQITDNNPVRAAEASQRLTEEFVNYAGELKKRSAHQTVYFLEKQSEAQLKKMKEAEGQIKSFAGKSGSESAFLFSMIKTKGAQAELITFNNSYLKAKMALKETEIYLNQLREMVHQGSVPPKLLKENPVLSAIKETIGKLESQLSALRSRYPEYCPKNIGILKEIDRHKQLLNKEMKADIDGRYVDMAGLQARVKLLKETVDHFTALARMQWEYSRLYRNYEVLEEGYQDLLRHIQQARLTASLDTYQLTPIEIIDQARVPKTPVSPNHILNTLIGMLLGALLGLGLAFIFDYFDPTLKSAEDVERYLNLPVLGSVPRR
ncbi:MAG: hypothetical protein HY787_19740 [Deltaproteobacteria bacterium]|nr:hypothetical protein [Deltaproteobacteria bacterium]